MPNTTVQTSDITVTTQSIVDALYEFWMRSYISLKTDPQTSQLAKSIISVSGGSVVKLLSIRNHPEKLERCKGDLSNMWNKYEEQILSVLRESSTGSAWVSKQPREKYNEQLPNYFIKHIAETLHDQTHVR